MWAIIDELGYKMVPVNIERLKNMKLQQSAAELAKFVFCRRLISAVILEFTGKIEPLTKAVEEAYKKSGWNTFTSMRKMPLS